MSMFCYQCEQTARGTGCTVKGVCGKEEETAVLQDLLVYVTKGVAQWAHRLRSTGMKDAAADRFVVEALFTTVTNVNFDAQTIRQRIYHGAALKNELRRSYEKQCAAQGIQPQSPAGPATFQPEADTSGLSGQGQDLTLLKKKQTLGDDIAGLQELILYGLKGMAAYMDHAMVLGKEEDEVFAFFHHALNYLAENPTDVDSLVSMAMKTGEVNLKVMGLLDAANTEAYGHPEPTQVRITPVAGKCILVSGHDLKDLDLLLQQTEGKGIHIYTHGEMLPCNAYPGLKKYKHLVGNYGGAWQDQQKEFDQFPGAILMTTNCIQKPAEGYKQRIFTTGLVEWPGVVHVENSDFSSVIRAALEAPGFTKDEEPKYITVGFAHNTVMSVAGKVVEAVKAGAIRHFFLIGGCDGAKSGRNYYTEFAQAVPEDCVILTLACGKYRFNKLDFGEIGGIPRLLDCGQCNDAYSAIQIAVALSKAFGCGVNDLPLSLILSWYEQKAVCILLTLLYLGIKKIRIGPSLPAFVGPNVLNVLVEKFQLTPIKTAEEDLKSILQG